jgi:hypothetical protein
MNKKDVYKIHQEKIEFYNIDWEIGFARAQEEWPAAVKFVV